MEVAVSEAAQRVRELMERLVSEFGVDATVEVREDDEGVTAELHGDDLGLVIGHHGQTIDAIQHLAYRIAFMARAPASASSSMLLASASVEPSRSAPPPTRPPRRPSTTTAPSLWRR